jgi:hypothetical protein
LDFDDLYRRHLRNVYQMLGQPVPEELFVTNISTGGVPRSVVEPMGLIHPTLDGKPTSYFEWLGAGTVETDAPSGVMTGGERRQQMVTSLLYGFDHANLYLRVDLAKPAGDSLRDGTRCTVHFTAPAGRRLILSGERGRTAALLVQLTAGGLEEFLETKAQVAAAEILEAAIPFVDLGLKPDDPFGFFVSVERGPVEVERHPMFRPVEGRVPGPTTEQMLWKA